MDTIYKPIIQRAKYTGKKMMKIIFALLFLLVLFTSNLSFAQTSLEDNITIVNAEMLKSTLRTLSEEQILWTRTVILCIVDDLPGKDQAMKRLIQNQVDRGNIMKFFYGENAGNEYIELLKFNVSMQAEIIKQAKIGNTNALNATIEVWNTNNQEIYLFLRKANPNWALAEMTGLINNHNNLTMQEVVQRLKKNYEEDVIVYDKIHTEILKISDMLAEDIVRQFPEKFQTPASLSVLE